ncbi:hypothetical protein ACLKA7_010723 [Drosophila subpalustris]
MAQAKSKGKKQGKQPAKRVHKISAAGNFELEILEISNTNSHLLSGYCCGVPTELRATKTTGCSPCTTAFRLCLKEYQTTEQGASISTGCSFGNATTKILGGSSFVLSDPGVGAIVLPFTFRWTLLWLPLHPRLRLGWGIN